tara:strand:+ start:539 stop:856 length:318 start_codon:yes stop_codon:yes gene_type:complete
MQSNMLMFEAIALRKVVTAVYNRGRVMLAPHILYTKNDALHIDAITIERDGVPPREAKLGTFKLDGLAELALTDRPFEISPLFEAGDEKYSGVTLFAVEAESVSS